MLNKKELKSISGFIIAILISIIFIYFLLNCCNLSDWWLVICSYLFLLAISLLIFCVWLEMQIFFVPFIPVFPIIIIFSFYIQKIIKINFRKEKVKQNSNSKVVVIVTNFNWYNVEYYINNIPTPNDAKELVKYLAEFRSDFSFYLKPTREDIENVMSDQKVREVYFLGHGNSTKFQINAVSSLEYKEFNNKKYSKDLVHQVHCGTKYGKPLRYYVVSRENWDRCFFVRKSIAEKDIVEYFKNKKS